MTKRTRTAILCLSVAVFIFVGFGVVMMALGYGYDFANGRVVKTGALFVKTNISAKIFINDREQGGTSFLNNSFGETRLLPGIYSLRIDTEERKSWQKNIEIKEGLLTEFSSVFLPEDSPTPEVIDQPTTVLGINAKPLHITKERLYFLNKNQLYVYDFKERKATILIKNVRWFNIKNNEITYLTLDNTLHKYTIADKKIAPVILTGVDLKKLQSFATINNTLYAILTINGRTNFYKIENGEALQIALNIESFTISPDENKIALHNRHELFIYRLKESNAQPYQEKDDLNLITRTSKTIADVQWFKDSQHLLINQSRTIIFSELDTRDQLNSYPLSENKDGFYYDKDSDNLYLVTNREISKIIVK